MERHVAATGLVLVAGLLPCAGLAGTYSSQPSAACSIEQHEVFVPAGRYEPFYKRAERRAVPVGPMCLGAGPVTNAQFLEFVRHHPEWRRSRVKRVFAEETYLSNWRDDLAPPPDLLSEPVTFVSWFAADDYCESRGARLPKVSEWERVAGRQAAAHESTPFAIAMGRPATDLEHSPLQLKGIWEWTEDFNSSAQGSDPSLFCGDGYRAVDASDYAAFLRYSFRSSLHADFALKNLGFRCTRGADEISARSIYQLPAAWTTDDGRSLRLRELAGEVQVLTFFYTSCEAACPMTVKALQSLSLDAGPGGDARARFLLVSVDPAHDSLAALRQYRRTMKLDPDRWKLLRGPPAEVRKLAALLGFNYEEVDSGQFVHSNLVTVLNARGEVVHQQDALGGNLPELTAAIRAARAER